MLTQGVLPFQYHVAKKSSCMTSLAGLGPYLDLIYASGLPESIRRNIQARTGKQGWTDAQIIPSLILLNLAGGNHVNDLNRLENDPGLKRLLSRIEKMDARHQDRQKQPRRRWRKIKTRVLPSASATFNYLSFFRNHQETTVAKEGVANIPESNAALCGLLRVNKHFLTYVQKHFPETVATLDQDATLVPTNIRTAKFCYQHFRAYQPLNTYWHEEDLLVHTEFRDGNVPAGFQEKRVLEEALSQLPEGIQKVYLRTDTAGYQQELLRYCAEGSHKRFGVIEFAIGADVTPGFKAAVLALRPVDWHPITEKDEWGNDILTLQEWAEVCFVPEWISHRKDNPHYRYLAIREPLQPGRKPVTEWPFPTMRAAEGNFYKVFGLVTNRSLPGNDLIHWHRQRCGQSEEVHAIQKQDLAGGYMPSHWFGVNAAWWGIMILAYNLNSFMKREILRDEWKNKRLKALRYSLIYLPAQVIRHGRQIIVRLAAEISTSQLLIDMRTRIFALGPDPPDNA
jgi:hypothetical protein